jgi:hypothetical protein
MSVQNGQFNVHDKISVSLSQRRLARLRRDVGEAGNWSCVFGAKD